MTVWVVVRTPFKNRCHPMAYAKKSTRGDNLLMVESSDSFIFLQSLFTPGQSPGDRE